MRKSESFYLRRVKRARWLMSIIQYIKIQKYMNWCVSKARNKRQQQLNKLKWVEMYWVESDVVDFLYLLKWFNDDIWEWHKTFQYFLINLASTRLCLCLGDIIRHSLWEVRCTKEANQHWNEMSITVTKNKYTTERIKRKIQSNVDKHVHMCTLIKNNMYVLCLYICMYFKYGVLL